MLAKRERRGRARFLLVTVIVASLAGLLVVIATSSGDGTTALPPSTGTVDQGSASGLTPPQLEGRAAETNLAPAESVAVGPDPVGRLRVTCGSRPVPGLTLEVSWPERGGPRDASESHVTDPEGEIRIECHPGEAVLVSGGPGIGRSLHRWNKGEGVRDIALEATPSNGRVITREGSVVPGATIQGTAIPPCQADSQGAFSIDCAPLQSTIWAQAPGYDPSSPRFVGASPVDLVLGSCRFEIRGEVHDSLGTALPGATVRVGLRSGPTGESRVLRTVSSDLGTFSIPEVFPGIHDVTVDLEGYTRWRETVEVREDSPFLLVQLDAGATVLGRVLDKSGKPVRGALVGLPPFRESELRSVWSATDGSYLLQGVPVDRPITLEADGGVRGVGSTNVTLAANETRPWNPILGGGSLRGRLRDESGLPLSGWHAAWKPADRRAPTCHSSTAQDGSFALSPVFEGPGALEFRAGDWAIMLPPNHTLDLPTPPESLLEVRVPREQTPVTFVRGRVDAEGAGGAKGTWVILRPDPPEMLVANIQLTSEDGTFRVGPLQSGHWTVRVGSDALGWGAERPVTIDGRAEMDLGVLPLTTPAWLEVSITDEDGSPWESSCRVKLQRVDQDDAEALETVQGRTDRLGPFQEGHFELSVRSPPQEHRERIHLERGVVRAVTVALRK